MVIIKEFLPLSDHNIVVYLPAPPPPMVKSSSGEWQSKQNHGSVRLLAE
jgi:hypothetical protein